MNKTVIGQLLNIILIWSLYLLFRTKSAFDLAYEGKYLEAKYLSYVLLSAALVFLLIGLMIYVSMKGKKLSGLHHFLKADISVSEEDERDSEIIGRISRKNYLALSGGLVAMIVFAPVLIGTREITLHGLVLALAVIATADALAFLLQYIKAYKV
ncbi:MAG TPA: hypothetical protein DEF30_02580 [Proteiniclasticum sp.]|uniref:hypothetical protein n=1 Tax=Proteiniclasticum sp. TaxID=2053595 RepID=UPI000E8614E5|nr:hypothetical protein [Proteiniclasticum sp.]HBW12698.1 hypothetical protein [Proteiniclasticum sp.]